nr:DUF362 domain-containing protein [Geobacter hydrogenophilus]
MTRREFLRRSATGGAILLSGGVFLNGCSFERQRAETFIAKVEHYNADIAKVIVNGLRELGVGVKEIQGKRVLLKPNMVEPHSGAGPIITHPLVIRGAVEAFKHLGASRVLVAEGPGHCRDSILVLEESGVGDVLHEDRIPFVDLNYDSGFRVANAGRLSELPALVFPSTLQQIDLIVSMPKMKTHHWAGVTLSMKNMFGVMPGSFYGWPKNVLHFAGIDKCILDINLTLKPHLAIVDGIVGMEGDGPIMGTPKQAGVLVMGRNLAAVDATCSRVMGIDPHKIGYLKAASGRIGPIKEANIDQRGEKIASVRTNFALIDKIPAHHGIRLG